MRQSTANSINVGVWVIAGCLVLPVLLFAGCTACGMLIGGMGAL